MGTVQNSEYQTWIDRLNALRTKHGLAQPGLSAPGNVKITATKMNELLSNMSMSSKWLNQSLATRVTRSTIIQQTIANTINNTLTSWESVCVHNSFNGAFFTAVFNANHGSNWGNRSDCSDFNDDSSHHGDCSLNSDNSSNNSDRNNCGDCSEDNSDWSFCTGDNNWSCGDHTNYNHDWDYSAFGGCNDKTDFTNHSDFNDDSDDSFNSSNRSHNVVMS